MTNPATELPQTLVGGLAHFASERSNDVALREKRFGIWEEISWRNYYDEVQAVGRMLREIGVEIGDHVAIQSDNRREWVYADLGAQGIGARSVGIYQTNPPGDLSYILNHSQSTVLFAEDQEQVDKALEITDETPDLKHIIVFDPRGTHSYSDPRLMTWEHFITEGRRLATEEPEWFARELERRDPNEASMVVYTSGTTGQPKGALISPRGALDLANAMAPLLGASARDTSLSYLPLCHVAEKIFTLFMPLYCGSVVHFGESIETIREDLKEVSPTVFLGVPRIWEKMHANVILKMKDSSWLKRNLYYYWTRKGREIEAKRRKGTATLLDKIWWKVGDVLVFRALQERLGLRRCWLPVSGAAPISQELLEWFHGIGIRIVEGYGQTEGTGVSHVNRISDVRLGTVGRSLPHVECRLAEDGEILVRSTSNFVGYLHNEEATRETMDDEGWLHTGDIGEIEEDYLRITGRKKQIIITAGGKNLSPEKIENALKLSPFIKEVVAIGDRRKFISALIQIDGDAVSDWATRRKITHTSFEDLSQKEEVLALISQEVQKANEILARVEQVRVHRLFKKELHEDDGELTPTQKVRRTTIIERYQPLIESMYVSKGAG